MKTRIISASKLGNPAWPRLLRLVRHNKGYGNTTGLSALRADSAVGSLFIYGVKRAAAL